MKIEHTNRDFEIKFAEGAEQGVFSGYGAVFGNQDSHGDVIEKGAFTESLRAWNGKGKYPPMLLQHGGGFLGGADDMLPVGVWTSMEENTKGLKVEGKLYALNTERGTYLYEGLKAGTIDGLSIGYRTKKYTLGTKPGEPNRRLEQVDLVELSIVLMPSNDRARVGSVKSSDIDTISTLSDAERFLRDAEGIQFSKTTACAFVSRVKSIALREAADDRQVADLLRTIRSARETVTLNP